MKFVRADNPQAFLSCNVLSLAFDWPNFQSNAIGDTHNRAIEAHATLQSEKNDWKSLSKARIETKQIHTWNRTTLNAHYIQLDV